MIKYFYLTHKWTLTGTTTFQVKVDLGVMAVKGLSTLLYFSRTGTSPSDSV